MGNKQSTTYKTPPRVAETEVRLIYQNSTAVTTENPNKDPIKKNQIKFLIFPYVILWFTVNSTTIPMKIEDIVRNYIIENTFNGDETGFLQVVNGNTYYLKTKQIFSNNQEWIRFQFFLSTNTLSNKFYMLDSKEFKLFGNAFVEFQRIRVTHNTDSKFFDGLYIELFRISVENLKLRSLLFWAVIFPKSSQAKLLDCLFKVYINLYPTDFMFTTENSLEAAHMITEVCITPLYLIVLTRISYARSVIESNYSNQSFKKFEELILSKLRYEKDSSMINYLMMLYDVPKNFERFDSIEVNVWLNHYFSSINEKNYQYHLSYIISNINHLDAFFKKLWIFSFVFIKVAIEGNHKVIENYHEDLVLFKINRNETGINDVILTDFYNGLYAQLIKLSSQNIKLKSFLYWTVAYPYSSTAKLLTRLVSVYVSLCPIDYELSYLHSLEAAQMIHEVCNTPLYIIFIIELTFGRKAIESFRDIEKMILYVIRDHNSLPIFEFIKEKYCLPNSFIDIDPIELNDWMEAFLSRKLRDPVYSKLSYEIENVDQLSCVIKNLSSFAAIKYYLRLNERSTSLDEKEKFMKLINENIEVVSRRFNDQLDFYNNTYMQIMKFIAIDENVELESFVYWAVVYPTSPQAKVLNYLLQVFLQLFPRGFIFKLSHSIDAAKMIKEVVITPIYMIILTRTLFENSLFTANPLIETFRAFEDFTLYMLRKENSIPLIDFIKEVYDIPENFSRLDSVEIDVWLEKFILADIQSDSLHSNLTYYKIKTLNEYKEFFGNLLIFSEIRFYIGLTNNLITTKHSNESIDKILRDINVRNNIKKIHGMDNMFYEDIYIELFKLSIRNSSLTSLIYTALIFKESIQSKLVDNLIKIYTELHSKSVVFNKDHSLEVANMICNVSITPSYLIILTSVSYNQPIIQTSDSFKKFEDLILSKLCNAELDSIVKYLNTFYEVPNNLKRFNSNDANDWLNKYFSSSGISQLLLSEINNLSQLEEFLKKLFIFSNIWDQVVNDQNENVIDTYHNELILFTNHGLVNDLLNQFYVGLYAQLIKLSSDNFSFNLRIFIFKTIVYPQSSIAKLFDRLVSKYIDMNPRGIELTKNNSFEAAQMIYQVCQEPLYAIFITQIPFGQNFIGSFHEIEIEILTAIRDQNNFPMIEYVKEVYQLPKTNFDIIEISDLFELLLSCELRDPVFSKLSVEILDLNHLRIFIKNLSTLSSVWYYWSNVKITNVFTERFRLGFVLIDYIKVLQRNYNHRSEFYNKVYIQLIKLTCSNENIQLRSFIYWAMIFPTCQLAKLLDYLLKVFVDFYPEKYQFNDLQALEAANMIKEVSLTPIYFIILSRISTERTLFTSNPLITFRQLEDCTLELIRKGDSKPIIDYITEVYNVPEKISRLDSTEVEAWLEKFLNSDAMGTSMTNEKFADLNEYKAFLGNLSLFSYIKFHSKRLTVDVDLSDIILMIHGRTHSQNEKESYNGVYYELFKLANDNSFLRSFIYFAVIFPKSPQDLLLKKLIRIYIDIYPINYEFIDSNVIEATNMICDVCRTPIYLIILSSVLNITESNSENESFREINDLILRILRDENSLPMIEYIKELHKTPENFDRLDSIEVSNWIKMFLTGKVGNCLMFSKFTEEICSIDNIQLFFSNLLVFTNVRFHIIKNTLSDNIVESLERIHDQKEEDKIMFYNHLYVELIRLSITDSKVNSLVCLATVYPNSAQRKLLDYLVRYYIGLQPIDYTLTEFNSIEVVNMIKQICITPLYMIILTRVTFERNIFGLNYNSNVKTFISLENFILKKIRSSEKQKDKMFDFIRKLYKFPIVFERFDSSDENNWLIDFMSANDSSNILFIKLSNEIFTMDRFEYFLSDLTTFSSFVISSFVVGNHVSSIIEAIKHLPKICFDIRWNNINNVNQLYPLQLIYNEVALYELLPILKQKSILKESNIKIIIEYGLMIDKISIILELLKYLIYSEDYLLNNNNNNNNNNKIFSNYITDNYSNLSVILGNIITDYFIKNNGNNDINGKQVLYQTIICYILSFEYIKFDNVSYYNIACYSNQIIGNNKVDVFLSIITNSHISNYLYQQITENMMETNYFVECYTYGFLLFLIKYNKIDDNDNINPFFKRVHHLFYTTLFGPKTNFRNRVVDLLHSIYVFPNQIIQAMKSGELLNIPNHFNVTAIGGYKYHPTILKEDQHLTIILMCLRINDYDIETSIKLADEAVASDIERWSILNDIIDEVMKRHPSEFINGNIKSQQILLMAQYGSDTLNVFNRMSGVSGRQKMRSIYPLYLKNNAVVSWLPWFKSAVTIANFIKYLDRERLPLAYAAFDSINSRDELALHYLQHVKEIYNEPLISSNEVLLSNDGAVDAVLSNILIKYKNSSIQIKTIIQICVDWIKNRQKLIGVCMPVRNTQLITTYLLTLWLGDNLMKNNNNTKEMKKVILAQVGTGEGKSLIIAITSIYLVKVMNKKVHILINNVGLRDRDYASFQEFYSNFKLTSSKNDFDNDIVYCLLSGINNFYQQKIFRSLKPFENTILIVDEVDSLIIDESSKKVYVMDESESTPLYAECFRLIKNNEPKIGSIPQDVWEECQQAKQLSRLSKLNANDGYRYNVALGKYCLTNDKGVLLENTYSLWLEYINFDKKGILPVYQSAFYYQSLLYTIKQYEKIIGLTGAIGSPVEQEYLNEVYGTWLFYTPPHLDTCEGVCKEVPNLIDKCVYLYKNEKLQLDKIFETANSLSVHVPVLVITYDVGNVLNISKKFEVGSYQLFLDNDPTTGRKMNWDDIVTKSTKKQSNGRFMITITDYLGGRGHDYIVNDENVNIRGGMAVICCTIPESEREWIQWLGRTARNDNKGQYTVILRRNDEILKSFDDQTLLEFSLNPNNSANVKYNNTLITAILKKGDENIRKKLMENKSTIDKEMRVNALVDKFYLTHKRSFGSPWPSNIERNLRDFLKNGDFSESSCENFEQKYILK